jgi:hypothetical protein
MITLHKKLFHDYAEKFQEIFKVSLDKYWDYITGFDIVQFDTDLKCPDGVSLKDLITDKYGSKASELVTKLLT